MNYPRVYDEFETLRIAQTRSIARFGDGELRLAVGRQCSSQSADKSLAEELRRVLSHPGKCLACIPRMISGGPKQVNWQKYTTEEFTQLYTAPPYGSAFITRPDSAPVIDKPEFWDSVKNLWRDKQVVLVRGDSKSLTPERLPGAREILRDIMGPSKHAYAEIKDIERQIGVPTADGTVVLICLGATATVLAWRLAQKGVHALDLGHIGMFMKHRGAFALANDELVSDEYRALLRAKHAEARNWGNTSWRYGQFIESFAKNIGAADVLDYGCGIGRLKSMHERTLKIYEYDPGVPGKDHLPKPAGLVVCTDVLEHVEPDKLDAVLGHICTLTVNGAYLVISMRPAGHELPDGRNAHLIVEGSEWWLAKLRALPWQVGRVVDSGRQMTVEIRK